MTARIEAQFSRRSARRRSARRAVALAAGWVLGGFVATTGLIEEYAPASVDPEYVARRDRLRRQLADGPDRPTLVVVGSSRVALGFAPEQLPPLATADGRPVVAFNLAHVGAGPTMNRIVLERLFRDGHRPLGVIVELMPAFLCRESTAILAPYLQARELGPAAGSVDPAGLAWSYTRCRVTAFPTMVRTASGIDEPRLEFDPPGPLGGPTGLPATLPDDYRARRSAEQVGFHRIREFRVPAGRDRAVRETVALCRAHGAEVRFLLTPEAPGFRPAYGPGCEQAFVQYVRGLAADLDVAVIDARDWLADDDCIDSHHALPGGAARFTLRLGREVLAPWAAGW